MTIKSTVARLGAVIAGGLMLCGAIGSTASAASITTLFGSNNSGSPGGAVYFNLTTGANPLTITGLDTNTAAIGAFGGFGVYTKTGTASGFEGNLGAWTLRTLGTLTANGLNVASPVALASSFVLGANTLFGVALVMPGSAGHFYTNGLGCIAYGAGGNCQFLNADLTLNLGTATNVPFTVPLFSPRTWNGTIYYNTAAVPEPATLALFGLGLAGLGFARRRKQKAA